MIVAAETPGGLGQLPHPQHLLGFLCAPRSASALMPGTPPPSGPASGALGRAGSSTAPRSPPPSSRPLAQHLVGVLAERRRRPLDRGRGAARASPGSRAGAPVAERRAARARRPSPRSRTSSELERLVEVEDRLDAAVVLVVERAPLLAGPRRKISATSAWASDPGALELLLDQVLAADAAAPGLPELRLQRAAGDPAVLRLVGPVTDDPARRARARRARGPRPSAK